MIAAFALSPRPRPSTPPAASPITFFAAAQSSTPIRSWFDVDAKRRRGDRLLQEEQQRLVVGGDHGRTRQSGGDLLRHVRPGEHGDRAAGDERREPLAALGIEALDEAENRRSTADVRRAASRNERLGTAITTRSACS